MILLLLLSCRGLAINDVTTGETPEYPEIRALYTSEPPTPVWQRVLAVSEEMGWKDCEITNLYELHCVAVTPRMEWEDDVWIRLHSSGTSVTKVWMRSASRTGKGDMGTNAKRILAFQAAMLARGGGPTGPSPDASK